MRLKYQNVFLTEKSYILLFLLFRKLSSKKNFENPPESSFFQMTVHMPGKTHLSVSIDKRKLTFEMF
jgi:hypothetical protein